MHRRMHQIIVSLFILGFFLPMVYVLFDPPHSSPTSDKSTHNQISTFSPGSFQKEFENDFLFREKLIYVYSLIHLKILKLLPFDDVIQGTNGWFFYNGEQMLEEFQRPSQFSEKQLKQWANTLQSRHDYLQQNGVTYVFAIAPNKLSIYPEYLPANIKGSNQQSLTDQLISHLRKNTNVAIVDLRPELFTAKSDAQVFQKTDTHWNEYGAYRASVALLQALQPIYPDLRQLNRQPDVVQSLQSGGHLVREFGSWIKENHFLPEITPHQCIEKRIHTDKTFYWTTLKIPSQYDCPDGRLEVLVFRDSFTSLMKSYLSPSFSKTQYFWIYPNGAAFQRILALGDPDLVLEIRVERHLSKIPYFSE